MSDTNNTLSEDEIIAQAVSAFAENYDTVLEACEAFYMNGSADSVGGNVDYADGHYYRVHRWIVFTNSQGFHDLHTYDTEKEAKREIEALEFKETQADPEDHS